MPSSPDDDRPWHRVTSDAHLQLSAVDPPTGRVPGPVIGPGSRVRPCPDAPTGPGEGVICLEVDVGGRVERGYTVRRMVAFAPESNASGGWRRWLNRVIGSA